MQPIKTPRPSTPVEDPTFFRSRFHLTPDQVRFFDRFGYLILPQQIPADLIHRLRGASEDWIRQGEASRGPFLQRWDAEYVFSQPPVGEPSGAFTPPVHQSRGMLTRVNYLHDKGSGVSLELLGAPQVLAVAESLCGVNFVPTYESMLICQEGDILDDRWHQNAIHSRRWRLFNLMVCLDPLRKSDGAMAIVPGTQNETHLPANSHFAQGWNISNVIHLEMEPGDVLLHDVMLVHSSPRMQGPGARRMLYYEFRPAEQILAEGPWERGWVERRLRLLPEAIRRYAQAFPRAETFRWRVNADYRPGSLEGGALDLKVLHGWHTAGAWCSVRKGRHAFGR
jgi:hypothetical protein